MKFAIATVAFWEALGYDTANWRKSNDGNQAITELKYAEILGVNLAENPQVKIYFGDNPELIRLLDSEAWHRDGTNGPFDSYNLLEQLAEVDTRLTTAMANLTELVIDAEENGKFIGVPTSATATGYKGDFSADANYMYVCYATNQWIRIAKSTW